MPIPKQQITVSHDGGTEDLSELNVSLDVWLRENKGSNASISPLNKDAAVYLNQVEQDDPVFIRLKRDASDAFTKVFGGYAVEITPEGTASGLIMPTKCYGFEVAFNWLRVAKEYGLNSLRSDLRTVYDVLTDNTGGVLPKYFSKVLAGALDSGYTCETTYLYEDAADFLPYVIFPYTPISDALKTLLDLYTASTGNGLHWTALQPVADTTAFQFCMDLVNNHTTAAARWPTNCPVTITSGENLQAASYTKQASEANYIVYFGKYQYPVDEMFTEDAHSVGVWTDFLGAGYWTESDDASSVVGSTSLKWNRPVAAGAFIGQWYAPLDSLDTNAFGTRRTTPTMGFYVNHNAVTTLKVRLGTGAIGAPDDCFLKDLSTQLPAASQWGYVKTNLGLDFNPNEWTVEAGTPDWGDLDWMMIWWEGGLVGNAWLQIDGLSFDGIITRAAYENGASTYKIKPVTDSLAVSANLSAAVDTGSVEQLCKAEYLRAKTAPTLGTLTLKGLYPTICPGQIIASLNYRITEVHFHLDGKNAYTELATTDDLTNSYPAENLSFGPTAQYNALMRAVNPDFQDRDRGTLKAREIDIGQSILAKAY